MSNRNYSSGGKLYSMYVKPVMVATTFQIGAAGAVGTITQGVLVQSITRLGTGLYKIKLQPQTNFNSSISAIGSMHSPVSGLSGITTIEIQNAASLSAQTADGAELTVKTLSAGALADPAAGSSVNVLMLFSDSSVK